MRGLLALALIVVLFPTTVNALTLRWESNTDTLNFVSARRAVLVLRADPPDTPLPSEWRLLWVGDNAQVTIQPVDSLTACDGDTAAVHDISGPMSAADSAAHLMTARFCSGGAASAVLAAWVLDLPAQSRGRFVACAISSDATPVVTQSNSVYFNTGVSDSYVANASLRIATSPSYAGRPVTLHAIVLPYTLTGTVVFREGTTVLATASLLNGVASATISSLGEGVHPIHVAYDSVTSDAVLHTVLSPIQTSTTLTASPAPSLHQRTVLLTATVTPTDATGSVVFRDGITVLGNLPLSAGVASLSLPTLSVGMHEFAASYAGDLVHAPSTAPLLSHEVLPLATTSLSIRVWPDSAIAGDSMRVEARIAPTTASGTVEFRLGSTLLGVAAIDSGVSTLHGPVLCAGLHSLSATYAGDSLHYGSTAALQKQVHRRAPKVTVRSSSPFSRYTQSVHFTAYVRDTAGTPCELSGVAQFFVDDVPFGYPTSLMGDSVVSEDISSLQAGDHVVRVSFGGNTHFLPGDSSPIVQHVESPSPQLVGVKDVSGDQGGRVKLFWNASYLDLAPFTRIESYWILRSVPSALAGARAQARPVSVLRGDGGAELAAGALLTLTEPDTTHYWEYLGSQPALHLPKYSFVASTTTDSTAAGNPYTMFMIMARASAGSEWWFSNADSGYSVDNLPPAMPQLLVTETSGHDALVTWQPNGESDLAGYRLYRGTSADFEMNEQHLVTFTFETRFADPVAGARTFYKLVAVDVHGNSSPAAWGVAYSTAAVDGGLPPTFGLEHVWPNPTRGSTFHAVFNLPSATPARLELLDVSGRRVAGRSVHDLGSGRHSVSLGTNQRVPPGVYLMRLTQGANVGVRRVVVLE